MFQEETERIPRLAYIGSLHRALLLKSGALLAWKMKDEISWQEGITQLLKLLNEAGLKHQMHTVQKYYGPALKPILESLGFFTE